MNTTFPAHKAVNGGWIRPAAVVLLSWVLLTACTTLVPMTFPDEDGPVTTDQARPQSGDRLVVTLKSGELVNLTWLALQDGRMSGTSERDGSPVSIQADQIALVERRESNPWKTALVVAGITSASLVPQFLEFFSFLFKGVSL